MKPIITLTADEATFLDALNVLLMKNGYDPIHLRLNRLADKTLNFRLTGCQIGRVKLQGRKTSLQVLTQENVYWYENISLEECISYLPLWLDYVNSNHLYDPSRPWYW